MASGNLTGFYRAPATQALLVSLIGGKALSMLFKAESVIDMRIGMIRKLELWRLVTSSFSSVGFVELVVFLVLLYRFRVFERMFGTHRFCMLSLVAMVVSKSLQMGILSAMPDIGHFAAGPYEIVAALMVYFHATVPKTARQYSSVAGIPFTEKSLTYIFGLLLMFSAGVHSVVPSLGGLMAGGFCITEAISLTKWRFPRFIVKICEFVLLPLFSSTPARPPQPTPQPGQPQRQGAMGAGTPIRVPPPSEELIASLVDMGFPRQQVLAALAATGNNRDAAIHRLLG